MTKKYFIFFLLSTFLHLLIFTSSCTSDKLEPIQQGEFCDTLNVSYNIQVRDIITTNCAYVGCHIAGFSDGDFTTYEGMLSRLDNGQIERRSVSLLDMPPSPDVLTTEEIEILSCWFSKGYPKE